MKCNSKISTGKIECGERIEKESTYFITQNIIYKDGIVYGKIIQYNGSGFKGFINIHIKRISKNKYLNNQLENIHIRIDNL